MNHKPKTSRFIAQLIIARSSSVLAKRIFKLSLSDRQLPIGLIYRAYLHAGKLAD